VSHVEALLERLSSEPNSPAESIDVLSEAERRRVLGEFNGVSKDFGAPACLHSLLAAQAERTPGATALACGDAELSYAQLDGRANRIARYLQRAGVGRGDKVALLMHRSPDLIASIFGILKAGACYVPIDPDTPRKRVAFIIGDAHPAALLYDRSLASSLSGVDIRAIEVQGAASELAVLSDRPVDGKASPSDLAYVIYTSGSTGNPKRVLIEHRAVYNYVRAAVDAYALCAEDRVLQFFSIAFDASVEEIFPILSCGGTLVLRPDDLLHTMECMIRRLGQMRFNPFDAGRSSAVWADSMRPSAANTARYDARRATAALASKGVVCPPVGGDLLRRYLNYLVSCGFLSLPEAVNLQVASRAS
jgi:non-ribosomal peptide synthetase component F